MVDYVINLHLPFFKYYLSLSISSTGQYICHNLFCVVQGRFNKQFVTRVVALNRNRTKQHILCIAPIENIGVSY